METYLTLLDRLTISSLLDILLVTAVIYVTLLLIRGTRAVQVLRGLLVLALFVALLSSWFDLPAFSWLINTSLPALLLAVPVIFQPELRRALEQVGRTGRWLRYFRRNQENPIIGIIKEVCFRLSQRRHGALIVFEQDTGLQEYVDTGVTINGNLSVELLLTIFNKHTELHDGAVIIREDKVTAAACVLPLSTSSLSDRQMGLRHRAAQGISEVSDAIALIVSEETGQVSIAHNGRILRRQDITRLDTIMDALFTQQRGNRKK
ncbi:MAG: diadenylate cyclase CdaA [Chloroflexota bacterium]